MGIFDRALDTEKTHEFNIDDTVYVVKYATLDDALKYVNDKATPTLKDEAMRAERTRLMNEYLSEDVIVSITDPEMEDTPENRAMILSYPEFAPDAKRIRDEAYSDDNFKMERETALKKFSPTTSLTSVDGKETTAATG